MSTSPHNIHYFSFKDVSESDNDSDVDDHSNSVQNSAYASQSVTNLSPESEDDPNTGFDQAAAIRLDSAIDDAILLSDVRHLQNSEHLNERTDSVQNNASASQSHINSESGDTSDTGFDQLAAARLGSASDDAILHSAANHLENSEHLDAIMQTNLELQLDLDLGNQNLNSETSGESLGNSNEALSINDHADASTIARNQEGTSLGQNPIDGRRERVTNTFNESRTLTQLQNPLPIYRDTNDNFYTQVPYGTLDGFDINALNEAITNLISNRNPIPCRTSAFFVNHTEHEIRYAIPDDMKEFGLYVLMDQLLIQRKSNFNPGFRLPSLNIYRKKKRTFNQICDDDDSDDNSLNFPDPSKKEKPIRIFPSTFLRTGSRFSLPIKLTGITPTLTFTNVDYDTLDLSGYFQFGNISIDFKGQIIDFIHNDLRPPEDSNLAIEGNIFNNLIRNKLIFSKKFEQYFDSKKRSLYTHENWKPFSLNKLGYIVSNSKNISSFKTRTLIDPVKSSMSSMFPVGSIFNTCASKIASRFEPAKFVSKWFEMPPLNQFINMPSRYAPINREKPYADKPENLLVCKDCTNLMISRFLFLRLEIDINDLCTDSESKPAKVYPDFIYKHRRFCGSFSRTVVLNVNHNSASDSNNGNYIRFNVDRYDFPIEDSIRAASLNNDDRHVNNETVKGSDNNLPVEGSSTLNLDDYANSVNTEADNEVDGYYDENFQLLCADNDLEFDRNPLLSRYFNGNHQPDEAESTRAVPIDSDPAKPKSYFNQLNRSGQIRNLNARSTLADWLVSNERNATSHLRRAGHNSDNEDVNEEEDDYDIAHNSEGGPSPYDYLFTSDRASRIAGFLHSLRMVARDDTYRNGPVSVSKLYKNNERSMKMILLVCINRATGDLHLVPGNMDPSMWGREKDNGELFRDVETFSKVFNLFMETNNSSPLEGVYAKEIKDWIQKEKFKESLEIQRLLVLQLLTNPSIINSYGVRREKVEELIKKRKNERMEANEQPNRVNGNILDNGNGNRNTEQSTGVISENERNIAIIREIHESSLSDSLKELLLRSLDENEKFPVDDSTVITFKPGVNNT